MCIEEMSKIYNIHRNTMSKWLKDQIICNRQLSPRKWQVATYELPDNNEKEKRIQLDKALYFFLKAFIEHYRTTTIEYMLRRYDNSKSGKEYDTSK